MCHVKSRMTKVYLKRKLLHRFGSRSSENSQTTQRQVYSEITIFLKTDFEFIYCLFSSFQTPEHLASLGFDTEQNRCPGASCFGRISTPSLIWHIIMRIIMVSHLTPFVVQKKTLEALFLGLATWRSRANSAKSFIMYCTHRHQKCIETKCEVLSRFDLAKCCWQTHKRVPQVQPQGEIQILETNRTMNIKVFVNLWIYSVLFSLISNGRRCFSPELCAWKSTTRRQCWCRIQLAWISFSKLEVYWTRFLDDENEWRR